MDPKKERPARKRARTPISVPLVRKVVAFATSSPPPTTFHQAARVLRKMKCDRRLTGDRRRYGRRVGLRVGRGRAGRRPGGRAAQPGGKARHGARALHNRDAAGAAAVPGISSTANTGW